MISTIAVLVACLFVDPPAKRVDVEAGSTTDTLTGNRGTWNEQYLSVATRDGPEHAAYAAVTSDQRFGLSDITYEAGAYLPVAPSSRSTPSPPLARLTRCFRIRPSKAASTSEPVTDTVTRQPTRNETIPVRLRTLRRPARDRYRGNRHFSVTITAVHLSNVPGTAMSAGVAYTGYLRCDTLSLALSGGRDVESTGVGANVALYQTISYTANDLHWFTPHTALGFGAGWYLLTGAYDRFELHVALHERF